MKPISYDYFPYTGMKVKFVLKSDNTFHIGKYDANKTFAKRFFDEDGNEYTSPEIREWEEIKD